MVKVLIIDDDVEVRVMLREFLRFNGYEVIEAGDGQSGIRQFDAALPDLVITDIVMPEQEGLSTIKEIRRKRGDAKIIAMSGGGTIGTDGYLKFARRFGADLVFEKPLELSELLKGVRTLLA